MKETGMEAASSGSSSTVKMDLGDSGCDRTLLPGACRGFGGLRGNAAGEASGARSFEARIPTGEMEIASVVLRSMMADSGVADAKGRHQGTRGRGSPIRTADRRSDEMPDKLVSQNISLSSSTSFIFDKKAAHTPIEMLQKSPAHTCSPLHTQLAAHTHS